MCTIPAAAAGILRPDIGWRKAPEGRCLAAEVSDDGRTRIQMPFVPVDEVMRLIDGLDADDPPARWIALTYATKRGTGERKRHNVHYKNSSKASTVTI